MINALLYCLIVMADTPPSHNLLALGDSYTVGEGVAQAQSWPYQLSSAMVKEAHLQSLSPTVLARTGWTTDELSKSLSDTQSEQGILAHCYPLVTLSIGVNDQYRGRPVAQFEQGFTELIRSAIALAGHNARHVLVISIPDWGQSPFALNAGADRQRVGAEIDRYNAAKQSLAERHGVTFIDITAITRLARHSDYAPDGLHPGETVYQRWVQAIIGPAKNILSLPDPCSHNP